MPEVPPPWSGSSHRTKPGTDDGFHALALGSYTQAGPVSVWLPPSLGVTRDPFSGSQDPPTGAAGRAQPARSWRTVLRTPQPQLPPAPAEPTCGQDRDPPPECSFVTDCI